MKSSELQTTQVFLSYHDFVIGLAAHYAPFPGLEEDILQQVFLEFIAKSEKFDLESPQSNIHGLLHIMTRHVARRYWDEHVRTLPETLRKIAEHLRQSAETEDDCPNFSEERHTLSLCLNKMPEKSKRLIHFYYYDNLCLKEVAELLNMKTAAVSKAICRLRERLRECIRLHRIREARDE